MSMETSRGDGEPTNDDNEKREFENFRRALDTDDDELIFAWQVENGKQVPLEIGPTEYIELKSEWTYAFIKGKSKEKKETWSIFYWIGEKSSDVDATSVATFALLLDSLVHSTINIHRETEEKESQAFDTIFKYDENGASNPAELPPKIISEEETRMILIEGKAVSAPYEVVFSRSYLRADEICLVAFNSETVYIYCGAAATEDAQILLTKKLAKVLSRKMGPQTKELTLLRSIENKSKRSVPEDEKQLLEQFSREFELISKKNPYKRNLNDEMSPARPSIIARMRTVLRQVVPFGGGEEAEEEDSDDVVDDEDDDHDDDDDDDDDDYDEDEEDDEELDGEDTIDLQIRHVHRDEHSRVREKNFGSTPLSLFPFRSEDCYVVDSCLRRVGLFVWMGTKSEMEKRVECVKRAELLLRERENCGRRPILLIDEKNVDLPTEPRIDVYLKSLIFLMNNLDLSWKDMLEPPPTTSGDFSPGTTEIVIPYASQRRASVHSSTFFSI